MKTLLQHTFLYYRLNEKKNFSFYLNSIDTQHKSKNLHETETTQILNTRTTFILTELTWSLFTS